MYELTQSEKVLSVIAFFVVTASIGLALCIGLILPHHWTREGYVDDKHDKSPEERAANCGCDRKKITTNYIDCIPRTFSNRVFNRTSAKAKPAEVCALVHDYPYVVSLHVAAYKDDHEERRFACSGTILTETWVLTGGDCVHNEDEFRAVKLRVGSRYWSKGGKEYDLRAIAKMSDEGPIAVKVEEPLEFGKYVNAVKLPKKGIYTTWITAVTVGWRKGHRKKYDKFVVQRWSTTPCTDHCSEGEVKGNPECSKKKFGGVLVAQNRLLVGIQTGTCGSGDASKIMFVDVQTEDYQAWFEYLVGEHEEPNEQAPLQSLEREVKGTTASPLNIYEVRGCAEASNESNSVSDYDEKTEDRTKKPKITGKTKRIETSEQTERTGDRATPSSTDDGIPFENRVTRSATPRPQVQTPKYYMSLSPDDFIVPDEETSGPSSAEIFTTYPNPTLFPPLPKAKVSKPSQLMADMNGRLPVTSRIDGTDEYGDGDYDRDEETVLGGRQLMPLSTITPNEDNYQIFF